MKMIKHLLALYAVVFVKSTQKLLMKVNKWCINRHFIVLAVDFYQRVSIASYASAGIARAEMSVRLSVTLRYCIKTKKASVTISSPSESLNILVSRNI